MSRTIEIFHENLKSARSLKDISDTIRINWYLLADEFPDLGLDDLGELRHLYLMFFAWPFSPSPVIRALFVIDAYTEQALDSGLLNVNFDLDEIGSLFPFSDLAQYNIDYAEDGKGYRINYEFSCGLPEENFPVLHRRVQQSYDVYKFTGIKNYYSLW